MRTIEEIEARKAEISQALEAPDADLDALQAEVKQLNAEAEELRMAAREDEQRRKQIADGLTGTVIETNKSEEETTMTTEEIRKSTEYVNAFAEYIRSGDPRECRALLKTENASGTVPVPAFVDEIIHHAWETEGIVSLCKRTELRGNVKVAFERAADPAYVHVEGTSAPTEESLTIGIVTLTPANLKKWIRLTDEDVTMGGEAFVRYVYEEVTHQIIKALADGVVADIVALQTTNQATSVGAAKITSAPSVTTIAEAYATLSDEATNPVIIMNKLTYADFIKAQAAGNFAVDPFYGMRVLFNNSLKAYSTASTGDVYAIVGDLRGEQINYPEGDGVVLKWDDLSEAEADLVKIVGRQYVAHAAVAPFAFARIAKPAAAT